jgi:ribokinase
MASLKGKISMAMVIVFGSLNIDLVMKVKEQPQIGETVLTPTYKWTTGGKGANQAIACSRYGAKTAMVGKVGDDGFGTRILNALKKDEVLASGVVRDDNEPTGMAFVTVDAKGDNQIVVASGANRLTTSDQMPNEILHADNVALMQMEVNYSENWDVIHRSKAVGAKTILNLAPSGAVPREVLDDLDYLIVNQIEGRQMAEKMGLKIEDSAIALASRLATEAQLTCVMTMGPLGCVAMKPDGSGWRVQAMQIPDEEFGDTVGAGDTFCGVFAACIFKKMSLQETLRHASVAASLACRGVGAQTSMPTQEEVIEFLDQIPAAELI